MEPLRLLAQASKEFHSNPLNPLANTSYSRQMMAGMELFERITRRYMKPKFDIDNVAVHGRVVNVREEVVFEKTFCKLRHFSRKNARKSDPKILVVAPMSGHHATLLRGTVDALIPHGNVYITDWQDARDVPLAAGNFNLDDYISYLIEIIHFLGEGVHTIAVCQPSVPLFAAVALMNEDNDPLAPRSMTLMGGPIDTRKAPTKVNQHAKEHPLSWFESKVITKVPYNHPGFMRRVYPGFLQLTGFMTMNMDRHIDQHVKLFRHLVDGDGESAEAHRKFYDEYLSVADLPADFYLDTIDKVFQRHLLPDGKFDYKGRLVNPSAIKRTALLAVEGEKDDISGVGQTKAALDICTGLPASKKRYHLQMGVGHYGIFNGRNYRDKIVPVILEHIRASEDAPAKRERLPA